MSSSSTCPYASTSGHCPGDCGACVDVDVGTVAERFHVISRAEYENELNWITPERAKRLIREKRSERR